MTSHVILKGVVHAVGRRIENSSYVFTACEELVKAYVLIHDVDRNTSMFVNGPTDCMACIAKGTSS